MLSMAIRSKELGRRVRGMSSKLSIKMGSRRTGLGTGAMTNIKKKSWLQQRLQWKQGSRICFFATLASNSSRE